MSYVKDSLMTNEKILFSARVHFVVFLPSAISFILTVVIFIIGLSNAAQVTSPGEAPPPVSAAAIAGSFVLCLSGLLLLNSIFLGIQALIIKLTTEFAVTNRRVIAKTGFIRRHTLEMLLPKIESVAIRQNVLGRIFNFGTVTVTGTGGTKESFRPILDPLDVRKKMNRIIEKYMQAHNQYQ